MDLPKELKFRYLKKENSGNCPDKHFQNILQPHPNNQIQTDKTWSHVLNFRQPSYFVFQRTGLSGVIATHTRWPPSPDCYPHDNVVLLTV